jgi:hypothetical protein
LLIAVEMDSLVSTQNLAAGYSRVPQTNTIIQELFLFLARRNIVVRARQVDREENSSSDALSKQDLQVCARSSTDLPAPH